MEYINLLMLEMFANAHIQAFEIPAASARYCLVGGVTQHSELFNILHKFHPSLRLPKK